jgi:hypothetical protein
MSDDRLREKLEHAEDLAYEIQRDYTVREGTTIWKLTEAILALADAVREAQDRSE